MKMSKSAESNEGMEILILILMSVMVPEFIRTGPPISSKNTSYHQGGWFFVTQLPASQSLVCKVSISF